MQKLTNLLQTNSDMLFRLAIAIPYFLFGVLKPPGLSPANQLIADLFPFFDPMLVISFIGLWEMAIAICILYKPLTKIGLLLIALHIPGTFLPLIFLPQATFQSGTLAPTLEGQYILKNLLIITAAIQIWLNTKKDEQQ